MQILNLGDCWSSLKVILIECKIEFDFLFPRTLKYKLCTSVLCALMPKTLELGKNSQCDDDVCANIG